MPFQEEIGRLATVLELNSRRWETQLRDARGRFMKAGSEMDAASRTMGGRLSLGLGKMAAALAAAGAAMAVLATRAAARPIFDLEQQFANLRKVTGDTFPRIREEIKALGAETRGVTLGNLVDLATEGSKLGVAEKDLVEFTRNLGMMKVAMDDIDTRELATQTARILNVFGTAATEAGRFGSALNKLADTSAASAGEILDVTRRLSGTASVLGMTEQQTLALATAMLEAGINIEVGGTAMSQTLGKLATDTEAFARVAGMSLEGFRDLLRKDALAALTAFQKGLARFDKLQQFMVLESLGIDGERAKASILQLGKTIDRVGGFTRTANQEWETMASLLRESDLQGRTFYGRLKQLGNRLLATGDTVNQALAPVFAVFFEKSNASLAEMGRWVEQNRSKIQSWASGFAKAIAGISTVVGSLARALAEIFGLIDRIGEGLAGMVNRAAALGGKIGLWDWAPEMAGAGGAGGAGAGNANGPAWDAGGGGAGWGNDPRPAQGGRQGWAGPPVDWTEIDRQAKAQSELADSMEKHISSLYDQAGALEMGADAWEDWKLSVQGATAAQIAEIKTLRDRIAAAQLQKRLADERKAQAEREQAAWEDAAQAAEQRKEDQAFDLMERTRTPFERFWTGMQELKGLAKEGFIDPETFRRAATQAREAFAREVTPERRAPAQIVGLADLARGIQLASLSGAGDRQASIESASWQQVKLMGRVGILLEQIALKQSTGMGRIMV